MTKQLKDDFVMVDKKFIDLANENMNRVQELENRLSKQGTRINNLTFNLAASRAQNKRYREVIEEIKKTADDYRAGHLLDIQDSFFVDEIIAIIKKMEGDLE